MRKINFNNIEKIELDFYNYINNYVLSETEEKHFLSLLTNYGDIFIFGGLIVDYFFSNGNEYKSRDIDIVLNYSTDFVKNKIINYKYSTTRFGGLKLELNKKKYDIWSIYDTWMFKKFSQINYNLFLELPSTSFFNLTSIIFSIKQKKFFMHPSFKKSITHKILDIVNPANPYPELCIIKSYQYKSKYNMRISTNLRNYILKYYNLKKNLFAKTQLSHFGKIVYSEEILDSFYSELKNNIIPIRKKQKQIKNQLSIFF